MESNSASAGKSIDWRVLVSLGCRTPWPAAPLCQLQNLPSQKKSNIPGKMILATLMFDSCQNAAGSPRFLISFPCLYLSQPWYRQERWESHNKALQIATCLWRELVHASLRTTRASLVAQTVKNLSAIRRPGFNPWVRKIPWRRAWQPTPVLLPAESHGQRSLAGLQSMRSQRVGHN